MLRNARIKDTTVEKKEFPAQKFQYFRYSSQLEQKKNKKNKKTPEFLSLDFPAGWEFWLFVSFCQSFHLPAEEHAKAKAKGLEKIGALVCRRHNHHHPSCLLSLGLLQALLPNHPPEWILSSFSFLLSNAFMFLAACFAPPPASAGALTRRHGEHERCSLLSMLCLE